MDGVTHPENSGDEAEEEAGRQKPRPAIAGRWGWRLGRLVLRLIHAESAWHNATRRDIEFLSAPGARRGAWARWESSTGPGFMLRWQRLI